MYQIHINGELFTEEVFATKNSALYFMNEYHDWAEEYEIVLIDERLVRPSADVVDLNAYREARNGFRKASN
jgi:hypothetical protein